MLKARLKRIRSKDILAKKLLDNGSFVVNKKTGQVRSKPGHAFEGVNSHGYVHVSSYVNGKRMVFQAHRVVCIATKGLVDKHAEMQVNHKDGNKTNNKPNNLEWATPLENTQHAVATGLRNQTGENHANSVYTEKQIKRVVKLLVETNMTQMAIAKQCGVTRQTVASVSCGKQWKHLLPDGFVSHYEKSKLAKIEKLSAYNKYMASSSSVSVPSSLKTIQYALKHGHVSIQLRGKHKLPTVTSVQTLGRHADFVGCKTASGIVVHMQIAGVKKTVYMHQIVAVSYLGLPKNGERHVGFHDGDNCNYAPANLYWKR